MNHFQKTIQNPVWFSLNETHKHFSLTYDEVQFYKPEICPFGAFINASKTKEALNAYAQLTKDMFLVSEKAVPSFDENHIVLNKKMEGCQMVLNQLVDLEITEPIIPLTEVHIQEVYNLIWLVMPGYYQKRTFDMGDYYGIFKGDKLVAISGQRMQTNDFIEVSGVVTHPDYARRGFGKQLTCHATKEILKTGKHPILHTTKGNPAIKLYQSLGFELTRDMNWWYFSRKD